MVILLGKTGGLASRTKEMEMDKKHEKGDIAYALLKAMLKERGFEIDSSFRRRVGRWAKELGIPYGEMLEFVTVLAGEILKEVSDTKRPPSEDELEGHGGGL